MFHHIDAQLLRRRQPRMWRHLVGVLDRFQRRKDGVVDLLGAALGNARGRERRVVAQHAVRLRAVIAGHAIRLHSEHHRNGECQNQQGADHGTATDAEHHGLKNPSSGEALQQFPDAAGRFPDTVSPETILDWRQKAEVVAQASTAAWPGLTNPECSAWLRVWFFLFADYWIMKKPPPPPSKRGFTMLANFEPNV